jgi:poly-beta-1,6-N-acetyl-D-glucosamine synthase
MLSIAFISFLIFLAILLYHYIFFPLFIFLLSVCRKRPVLQKTILPHVSVIVSAYKEEKVIGAKLQNLLNLDYPGNSLEIIVASDGNEDKTAEIVQSFFSKGVISSHENVRKGKIAAINRSIRLATGEVILLSDANSVYARDTLNKLVRNFADSRVGAVSGRKSILKDDDRASSAGDGAYWRYESFLKSCQSNVGSITTGDGEIFAFRKSLYKPVLENVVNDDAAITIDIIEQGYRVVYEPEAISGELASVELKDDFWVKVRMVAGGFQSVKIYFSRLVRQRPLFAFQFLSHKFLRWTIPIWLVGLFLSTIVLIQKPLFLVFTIGQIVFYSMALIGFLRHRISGGRGLPYFVYYFCLMNLAALFGMAKYMSGELDANVLWKKAKR